MLPMMIDAINDFWRQYWWGVLIVVVGLAVGITAMLVNRPESRLVSGYRVSAEDAKASDLYLQGKINEAEQAYLTVVKQRPKDWFAWNSLGNIYRDKDKLADAENAYLKALSVNPRFEQGYRNIYNIYYAWSAKDASQLAKGEMVLLKGLKLLPKSEMILEDLISYYAKIDDQQKLQQYRSQLAAVRASESSPTAQTNTNLSPRVIEIK